MFDFPEQRTIHFYASLPLARTFDLYAHIVWCIVPNQIRITCDFFIMSLGMAKSLRLDYNFWLESRNEECVFIFCIWTTNRRGIIGEKLLFSPFITSSLYRKYKSSDYKTTWALESGILSEKSRKQGDY